MNNWKYPDARGWIGIGEFALVLIVLAMIAGDKALLHDDFFKTIATLIIGAFIKDIVGWAYSATKSGSELAAGNQRIVEASAAANVAALPNNGASPDKPPVEPLGD